MQSNPFVESDLCFSKSQPMEKARGIMRFRGGKEQHEGGRRRRRNTKLSVFGGREREREESRIEEGLVFAEGVGQLDDFCQ